MNKQARTSWLWTFDWRAIVDVPLTSTISDLTCVVEFFRAFARAFVQGDDQVTSNNMLDFCAPYSKMAENFKPKANTIVCMYGEG